MPERLTPRKLKAMLGREIGTSEWFPVTQERVDAFAACTEDRQWIHVDRERAAAEGPMGGTVSHGYLLLSLLPHLMRDIPLLALKHRMTLNYGLDYVRFISPVRTGSRVRNKAVLTAVEKRGFRKVLVKVENTLEIEGGEKPAMIAELLALIVF
jgi:acyl dehydratase